MLIETPSVYISIHQVKEYPLFDCLLFVAKRQYFLIDRVEVLMFFSKHFPVKLSSVAPTTYSIYAPIIKYGSPSVSSAESFAIHAQLSELLTEIDHHRIGVHTSRNN